MKGRSVVFSSERGTWRTPVAVFRWLRREYGQLVDLSEPLHGDALDPTNRWPKRWYANPPYGRSALAPWTRKAAASFPTEVGAMLLPARTSTPWWHDDVLATAREIRFVRARLYFDDGPTCAGFPSVLVLWGSRFPPCPPGSPRIGGPLRFPKPTEPRAAK